MRYNAIVFRPFKGEVFDAVVTVVNKLGFFAQVGPLQVFVSKHLIPEDMAFDPQVRCLHTLAREGARGRAVSGRVGVGRGAESIPLAVVHAG